MANFLIFYLASLFFIGAGILIPTALFAPVYIKDFLLPRVIDGHIINIAPIICATIVLHLFIYLHGFSNKKSLEKFFEVVRENKKGSFGTALKLMVFGDKNSKK